MSVRVTIDPRALNRILRGRRARQRVAERTERVAEFARQGGARHGSMGSAIRTSVEPDRRGRPRGTVWVQHRAGRYVLEGTRPHRIRPRRAKALRFTARSGDLVFTKLVRHPGYRGDNFLLEALRRGR